MKHKLNTRETIENFGRCWEKRNWRRMSEYIQLTYIESHKWRFSKIFKKQLTIKKRLKNQFGNIRLKEFQVIENPKVIGKTCVDIKCKFLSLTGNISTINMRLICEKEPYKPSIDGKWGINPISCLRKT